MKNFRVQIRAYGHASDFIVVSEDNAESIEKSILDKIGKNEVLFESDGFTNKKGKWIPYEEVINDTRTIQTEEVLGVKLGTRV